MEQLHISFMKFYLAIKMQPRGSIRIIKRMRKNPKDSAQIDKKLAADRLRLQSI